MKELQIIQIGNIVKDGVKFSNRQSGRIYCVDGIAPALNTCGGGNLEPKILIKGVCKCETQKKETN